MDELCSDCCEEPRCLATVTVISLEEEAGAEFSSLGESVGYGSRNRRFAGARHALQPEYAMTLRVVGPSVYLREKGFPCLRVAFFVVLVVDMIIGGAFGGMQFSENHFLVDFDY